MSSAKYAKRTDIPVSLEECYTAYYSRELWKTLDQHEEEARKARFHREWLEWSSIDFQYVSECVWDFESSCEVTLSFEDMEEESLAVETIYGWIKNRKYFAFDPDIVKLLYKRAEELRDYPSLDAILDFPFTDIYMEIPASLRDEEGVPQRTGCFVHRQHKDGHLVLTFTTIYKPYTGPCGYPNHPEDLFPGKDSFVVEDSEFGKEISEYTYDGSLPIVKKRLLALYLYICRIIYSIKPVSTNGMYIYDVSIL